eukprot:gene16016-17633_t
MKKKKFTFGVQLEVQELSNIPFLNGVVFCKVRQLDGGHFSSLTSRKDVTEHLAKWGSIFNFTCKMVANSSSGMLEKCLCRVSIRKEIKGGKSHEKLGYVDLNMAEFAGIGSTCRRYILDGYHDNKNYRGDNSILKVNINTSLTSGDPLFKPQIAQPDSLTSAIDIPKMAPSSKEDVAEEDQLKIPRSFSDSSQSGAGHMLPPMDGISTYPFHKRNSSVDASDGLMDSELVASGSGQIYTKKKSDEFQRKMDNTRVCADDVINQLMAGQDFTSEGNPNEEGSELKLVISRDGKASALAGYEHRRRYRGPFHVTIEEDDKYKTL